MVCEQARVQVRRASDEVQKMPTCSSRLPALKVTNSSLFLIIAGENERMSLRRLGAGSSMGVSALLGGGWGEAIRRSSVFEKNERLVTCDEDLNAGGVWLRNTSPLTVCFTPYN